MDTSGEFHNQIMLAVDALRQADALLIMAGSGMSVASGIGTYRGVHGFDARHPEQLAAGWSYEQLASPAGLRQDPQRFWGFYGDRYHQARQAAVHSGYACLRRWADQRDTFVVTSNVDGLFGKAGFADEQIFECHGSLMDAQCSVPCSREIWPMDSFAIPTTSGLGADALPTCPLCGEVLRPHVLMFHDHAYRDTIQEDQYRRYRQWLDQRDRSRLVVLEIGVGTTLPRLRHLARDAAARFEALHIHINTDTANTQSKAACTVAIHADAQAALMAMDHGLSKSATAESITP